MNVSRWIRIVGAAALLGVGPVFLALDGISDVQNSENPSNQQTQLSPTGRGTNSLVRAESPSAKDGDDTGKSDGEHAHSQR